MKRLIGSRITTMTRKGQVTIPVEMRNALKLEEGDSVEFFLDEGGLRMIRLGDVVALTSGSLRSEKLFESAEEERGATEEAIAADVVARMNR